MEVPQTKDSACGRRAQARARREHISALGALRDAREGTFSQGWPISLDLAQRFG